MAASTSTPPLSLEEAREALTATGWIIDPSDNIRKLKPPTPVTTKTKKPVTPPPTFNIASSTPLTITIDVPDQPDLIQIANYLRQRWSLLGIRVTVEEKDPDVLHREIVNNRTSYQVVVWNVLLPPSQDLGAFWRSSQTTGNGLNFSNFSDKDVDSALDAIRTATSTEQIASGRDRLTRAIMTRTPAIFIAQPAYTYLTNKRVRGVEDMKIAQPSDRLLRAETWYLNSQWIWN